MNFIFINILVIGAVVSYPSGPGPEVEVASGNQFVDPILTPFSHVGDVVDTKIEQAVKPKAVQFVTPFPDSGRQSAILESVAKESLPIQADVKYAKTQQVVADVFNPKPIVDTIQEHEKYGNDGGQGRAVGTKVVAAFEGFANILNAIVDTPFKAAKTVGRQITNSLNQLGGKLVGLA